MFDRALAVIACSLFLLSLAAPLRAETLAISVERDGRNAGDRPLPPGSRPSVIVTVHNRGEKPAGPVELTLRLEGISAERTEHWRTEDDALRTTIPELAPKAAAERALRLRVVAAPLAPGTATVTAETSAPGIAANASIEFAVADCAGAYRERLLALRAELAQPVRDAADAMRRADPSLPAGRRFPPTGAKSGELARAERLAATFARGRGADPQMGTEWFRFMVQRWASELNAYAGQAPNPGLCANNYYQIAGYREGLLPVTKHIDTTISTSESALNLLRKSTESAATPLEAILRQLIETAEIELNGESNDLLVLLGEARTALGRNPKLDPSLARQFSIAETAAWLAEADRRGRAFLQAMDDTLAKIADAHKQTCVCAF